MSEIHQVGEEQRKDCLCGVLSWAALAPDLGVEIVTGERTSLSLSLFGTDQPFGLPWQLLAVQPEFKFWFNGRPLTREYVGVSAFGARYDLTLPTGADRKYDFSGDALAAGLSGGYVFNLGRRWNFELSGGTGILFFVQKRIPSGNDEQVVGGKMSHPNNWGVKFFPTKLGATFIYIIK